MKLWSAGLVIIVVTFAVTLGFISVTAWTLADRNDEIRLPLLIVAAVIGLLGSIAFVVIAFSLFGLINGREPLGLPEGSVRALIALLILVIFASMTVFFFGALKNAHPNANSAAALDLAKQVLTILGTLLTAISSFYFGSQSAASAAKMAATTGGTPPAGGGVAASPSASPVAGATGTAIQPHARSATEQAS